MKNIRHTATIDTMDNRMAMSNHQVVVPKSKLSSGSVADKYPVMLDDGRTIVYITDKSREREIRLRYALRK
jgi:Tol biopolymer transport system component